MNAPINQHYVPQFYLRKFENPKKPGHVWLTDVEQAYKTGILQSNDSPIKKTTAFHHLYSNTNDDGTFNYDIEEFFGRIESLAGSLWQRLDDGTADLVRGSKQREILSRYIAAQHLRGPRLIQVSLQQLLHGSEYPEDISLWKWADITRFHEQVAQMPEALGTTVQDLTDREGFRNQIESSINKIAHILDHQMVWSTLSTKESAFITSDNPVHIYNHVRNAASSLHDRNAITYFPLTPKQLLLMVHRVAVREPNALDGKSKPATPDLSPMINTGIFNFSHKWAISTWNMATAVPQHFHPNWNA